MAMEAPESSDDDVSRTSLDESFQLEVQEPPHVESSRSYKHLYPDVPVFQHDELAESEDDMKIFASIVSANSKPANVRSVYLMLMNFACCKVFDSIKATVSRTDKKNLWLTCHNEFRYAIYYATLVCS